MEEKKVGIIGKLLGMKDEPEFNAEMAWIESSYGDGSYKSVDERIKEKQSYIKTCIKSKFLQSYQNGDRCYSGYHCVIDIEEDLTSVIDTVFEPFSKSGFDIINLSEQVKEIDEPNVYLISWKNAFKKVKKIEPNNEKIELIED